MLYVGCVWLGTGIRIGWGGKDVQELVKMERESEDVTLLLVVENTLDAVNKRTSCSSKSSRLERASELIMRAGFNVQRTTLDLLRPYKYDLRHGTYAQPNTQPTYILPTFIRSIRLVVCHRAVQRESEFVFADLHTVPGKPQLAQNASCADEFGMEKTDCKLEGGFFFAQICKGRGRRGRLV